MSCWTFVPEVRRVARPEPTESLVNKPMIESFWRVLAVDGDGFVGFPSKIFAFDVRP